MIVLMMLASDATESGTSQTIMRRILIVDDETDIIFIFKRILTREGYAVQAFSDPEVALQNFEPDNFDLAILDIRMPKMNGFELCREIRKRDAKVKIYFMTAFEINKSEFEKVLPSLHVNGFIKKPITITQISTLVDAELAKT